MEPLGVDTTRALARLQAVLGRPLRVAHFGNIANNAYLAAKAERLAGLDSHVISPNFSHAMGFPSWDEACGVLESSRHYQGDIDPASQPDWFHAGTWHDIGMSLVTRTSGHQNALTKSASSLHHGHKTLSARSSEGLIKAYRQWRAPIQRSLPKRLQDVIANDAQFAVHFAMGVRWVSRILSDFDVVNAYGPYNAYLPNIPCPLVSTEHGTLRDFVWSRHLLSRLSLRAYRRSRAIIVTNQDNLDAARRLSPYGASGVFPMPHPSNPETPECSALIESLRQSMSNSAPNRLLVLAPARHSAATGVDRGKGSEHLYEAIHSVTKQCLPVTFLLVDWGDSALQARQRLQEASELGYVQWLPLMTRPTLMSLMRRVHVVVDQFVIPAYGAVGLDALRCGTRLVTRREQSLDVEFFGAAPTVSAVQNAAELVHEIRDAIKHVNVAGPHRANAAWFTNHASWEVSLLRRLQVYEDVIHRS